MASAGDIEAIPLPVVRYQGDAVKGSYLIYSQEWVQDDEIEPGGTLAWTDLVNMLPPFYGNGDRLPMSAFAVRTGEDPISIPPGYILLFRPVLYENQFAVEWIFRIATSNTTVNGYIQYQTWYNKTNWLCFGRANTTPTTTLDYFFGNTIMNVSRTGLYSSTQVGLFRDVSAIQILALWVYANIHYYTKQKFLNLPVFTGVGSTLLDTVYDYISANLARLDTYVSDTDPAHS